MNNVSSKHTASGNMTLWMIIAVAAAIAAVAFFYNTRQMMTQAPGTSVTNEAATPAPNEVAKTVPGEPVKTMPGSATVTVQNFAFAPATITVGVGDTVRWENKEDGIAHSIVADDKSFLSDTLSPGMSFAHVFDRAGTFSYHCGIHPSMTGAVVVK